MKAFRLIFLTLAVLILQAYAGDGTWTRNAMRSSQPYGDTYRFTCTVDSIDTLTSSAFKLGKYDGVSWTTLPFWVQYTATSAAGSPKLTGYVQGSMDGTNWNAVDTLFTDATSETRTVTSYDFNNKKFPQYRILIYGVALNRSDTTLDLWLNAYQEQY